MDKMVFLDRDGTINEEVEYLCRPEDLKLLPTVPQAIRLLREEGFKIAVVTNQAGIARGYYTVEDMKTLHEYLNRCLEKDGALVDRFYYCPQEEYDIDKSRSFMIGDKRIDVEAGHNYGVRSILVSTGYGKMEREKSRMEGEKPFYDFYAETLMDAAEFIIREEEHKNE